MTTPAMSATSLRRRHFNFAQNERAIMLAPSTLPHVAHARSVAEPRRRHFNAWLGRVHRAPNGHAYGHTGAGCAPLVRCERAWLGFDRAWERGMAAARGNDFSALPAPAPAHMAACTICDDSRRAL